MAGGLAGLLRDLRALGRSVADTREPGTRAAEELAREASSRARRRTGAMAAGVTAVGPGVVEALEEYSGIVHEGYRGITPNPFMDQAADVVDVPGIYADHIEHELHDHIQSSY